MKTDLLSSKIEENMDYKLHVGDKMPSFTGIDQNGNLIRSIDLSGSPLIIYFYPKDDTPGCTAQACSFRDHLSELDEIDCKVIGISPDDIHSHRSFALKYHLHFSLLSDVDRSLCHLFNVLHPRESGELKVERTTFLIDREGTIRWIERPVNVVGHIERVLENLSVYI